MEYTSNWIFSNGLCLGIRGRKSLKPQHIYRSIFYSNFILLSSLLIGGLLITIACYHICQCLFNNSMIYYYLYHRAPPYIYHCKRRAKFFTFFFFATQRDLKRT
ncbi:hypothetical protein NG271_705 [Saccharomyces cerevisiae synthetic construct]|uniref:Putative uncharacterized protein YDR431W n=2 Tax=Saccharomyces cerevisiae TaxID=4932 RepID=YD431_YEAST|nr:RecName: Full=Putative uncharacterized protein YDR431W [Saccharomyces cerevisiae S288C]AAB64864.1 Ydr431wp [Saccharomyces cerevisiae]KZV12674.1 hypothetical protein WN66_01516 [Saccharomyces cerevisiae]WNF20256.1 hypothetical protein NG271_705 [Saccharomyces cerevisiae synthetic construct]CAY78931.1 EC1118_1D0_7382p [Saccharomyces cerevisiae EC1118]